MGTHDGRNCWVTQIRTVVVERLLDEKTSLTLRVEALRRSLPGTGCPGRQSPWVTMNG